MSAIGRKQKSSLVAQIGLLAGPGAVAWAALRFSAVRLGRVLGGGQNSGGCHRAKSPGADRDGREVGRRIV